MEDVTVGRSVHFTSHRGARCLHAVVTQVEGDGTISLCVFSVAGLGFVSNVVHDENPDSERSVRWHWPERV